MTGNCVRCRRRAELTPAEWDGGVAFLCGDCLDVAPPRDDLDGCRALAAVFLIGLAVVAGFVLGWFVRGV